MAGLVLFARIDEGRVISTSGNWAVASHKAAAPDANARW